MSHPLTRPTGTATWLDQPGGQNSPIWSRSPWTSRDLRAALAIGAPIGRAVGYWPTVSREAIRSGSRADRDRTYDRGRPQGSRRRR